MVKVPNAGQPRRRSAGTCLADRHIILIAFPWQFPHLQLMSRRHINPWPAYSAGEGPGGHSQAWSRLDHMHAIENG